MAFNTLEVTQPVRLIVTFVPGHLTCSIEGEGANEVLALSNNATIIALGGSAENIAPADRITDDKGVGTLLWLNFVALVVVFSIVIITAVYLVLRGRRHSLRQ